MLRSLGATIDKSRRGDRVSVTLRGRVTSQHVSDMKRGIMDKGAVASIRDWLRDMGITPESEGR